MVKKGRYFSPLTFNALAVIWIIAVLPIGVAFVSNLGSSGDGNYDWQQITKDKIEMDQDPTPSTGRYASWWDNGDNKTASYTSLNPSLEPTHLIDCVYIEDGYCQGSYEPTGIQWYFWNHPINGLTVVFNDDCDTLVNYTDIVQNVLNNCPFAEPAYYTDPVIGLPQPFSLQFDGSNYWRGYDAHYYAFNYFNNTSSISNDNWIGDSGDSFEIHFDERMMNQIENSEMIDALRFRFFEYPENDPYAGADHYNCENAVEWADLKITSTLTQMKDGEENILQSYTTNTDNKFYMEAFSYQFTNDGCYIGFEILIDLNGFDTRSMFNFVNGKWNESTLRLKMEFEREDGLPLSSTNIVFNQDNEFLFAMDYSTIEAQQVNFATNLGLGVISVANVALGIASTPYWDPFRNWFKGKI